MSLYGLMTLDLHLMARRVARRYAVAGMSRDDLVQEAWIVMWRALQRRPDHPQLEKWLRFRARDRLNKLAHANAIPEGEPLPEEDWPEVPPGEDFFEGPLLETLSERERLAVELAYESGFSVPEVAAWMHTTPNAVTCLLNAAYKKVGGLYDRNEGVGGRIIPIDNAKPL